LGRPITKEGFQSIQEEMDQLWRIERPEIVRQVSAAADLGDRSENAAYIYGKRRLREIDGRIRYLRRKIEDVTIIDVTAQAQHEQVRFGAVVTVIDDEDKEICWRLVDSEESAPERGRISIQSPIGQALSGKEVGDVVQVKLPKGTSTLEIIGLRYGGGAP
jgi:transcription elongation factor GreB